ncbi:MSMEG_1061 family FMN-dependent PPOX-type flavoprotein [Polaromonas sp. AER18D-145]|uniref:MSMEG_1061 family FMN-dependent PPOX-type flavoprotein n=1 Tax=Polaromonas sp. AER18D-145 TaxID=1977060 RepID=UPI000BBC58C5|nr:MSMEG_1061 family FMN-dependent PPOX-type flavoprotein [Polaromonas sp. AER18D-145]
MDLQSRFREVVTTEEHFRSVMGRPSALVTRKELNELDSHAREFIGRSPFLLIGTSGADGRMDMSPKGDPPGFVRVLDEKTLAIPDRLGNRRADTFVNLVVNDQIGLIFFVPGKQETLRVSGRAIIVRDLPVREQMAVGDRLPEFAIIVEVQQMFFHCAKCIIRSNLWKPEFWPTLSGLPSLAETMVSAGKLRESVEEIQAIVDKDAATRLY